MVSVPIAQDIGPAMEPVSISYASQNTFIPLIHTAFIENLFNIAMHTDGTKAPENAEGTSW